MRYAQNTLNVVRTDFITENTTKSHSAMSNTFQNVVENRNPYKSKNRGQRPETMPASLLCPAHNVIPIKDSEGRMQVSALA
jgi:hypothetical protein